MEYFFRRFFAVGQKEGQNGPFGQGFNYLLEVRFPLELERAVCRKAMNAAIATLDHKALGVDVNLQGRSTKSESLAQYLKEEIEKRVGAHISIRLERGDGFVFRVS